jgi:tetratricopeptide (TPR) repeat protein
MNQRPKVFIGSSVEGLNAAYAVQQNLSHNAEITVWDQGVFELSQTAIESLIGRLEQSDFGIFIFTPDDITKIRLQKHLTVRDNVIFELGLFIGKLGRNRSLIIMPDKPSLRIPTDLLGVTIGKYDTSRTDGSLQAATGPVCNQIRQQLLKFGAINRDNTATNTQPNEESERIIKDTNSEQLDWRTLILEEKYVDALSILEEVIKGESDPEKRVELQIWKAYVLFEISKVKGKEEIKKLIGASQTELMFKGCTRVLLWVEEYEYGLELIDTGLLLFPENEILISRKSELLQSIGQEQDALELVQTKKYLESDVLTLRLVDIYEEDKESGPQKTFDLLLHRYHKNPSEEIMYKLGRAAQELRREAIGLFLFHKLTNEHPNNAAYWGYLGNSCTHLGLTNKAFKSYRKAQELSKSKEAWIISNIGNLLSNSGLYHEARKYLDQALTLDKNSEYALTRLSELVKKEQDEEKKFSTITGQAISELIELKSTLPVLD